MTEDIERLERESAERRGAEILHKGLWKSWLALAMILSAGDFYIAMQTFYFKTHQERSLLSIVPIGIAILVPWLGIAGNYRRLRACALSSNASEMLPALRYAGVIALFYTYFAISVILHMCMRTG